MSKIRELKKRAQGIAASDGAGVKLTRIIGSPYVDMLDPFLLLDFFSSDQSDDYIAGFPSHPHRGFETVTYMLAGRMRHQDSVGNNGVLESGDVQWMTAGSGIIHSEMPEQEQGKLAGFQLWVNLPASRKMSAPKYQEYRSTEITTEQRDDGIEVKVIAGKTQQGSTGIIENPDVDAIYWDVFQPISSQFTDIIPETHTAFIYVYEGELKLGSDKSTIKSGDLAILEEGEEIVLEATNDSRYIVIAGKPLREPIARRGPFVMNTQEELMQAFVDYQSNNFIQKH